MSEFVSSQNRSNDDRKERTPNGPVAHEPERRVGSEHGSLRFPGVNCNQFEERVQELLDQRQAPADDPAIERHANECGPCARLLADFLVLESALRPSNRKPSWPQTEATKAQPALPAHSAKTSTSQNGAPVRRPQHPVSREQQLRGVRYMQAAVLLIAVGLIGFGALNQRAQRIAMLPVPGSGATNSRIAPVGAWEGGTRGAFQPVASYRSLEQCYELTSELPGVKPLQASILVALDWWQQYFRLSPANESDSRYHERGFGLNPLIAETRYQV